MKRPQKLDNWWLKTKELDRTIKVWSSPLQMMELRQDRDFPDRNSLSRRRQLVIRCHQGKNMRYRMASSSRISSKSSSACFFSGGRASGADA